MKNVQIKTVEDMEQFLKSNQDIVCALGSREEKYTCIREVLIHTKYPKFARNEKSIVKAFLAKVTRYEAVQLKRLIRQRKKRGLKYKKLQ